jgi:hypothetical protein
MATSRIAVLAAVVLLMPAVIVGAQAVSRLVPGYESSDLDRSIPVTVVVVAAGDAFQRAVGVACGVMPCVAIDPP